VGASGDVVAPPDLAPSIQRHYVSGIGADDHKGAFRGLNETWATTNGGACFVCPENVEQKWFSGVRRSGGKSSGG
jgi:hypothetical protein